MRSGPPVGPSRTAPTVDDAYASLAALELLDHKWVPPVLVVLASGPHRYAGLSSAIGRRVAKKVLLDTLARMERTRLLTRRVEHTDKARIVHYAIAPRGRSLLPLIVGLARWSRADAARRHPRPPDDGDATSH